MKQEKFDERVYTTDIPDNSILLREFRKYHSAFFHFLDRLQRAKPDCLYFKLQGVVE